MDAAASGRGRPLTPQMQQEVNAIVFQPKRVQLPSMSPPAAAPPAAATSGYLVSALTEDPMLVNPARAFAGKDSEDHFGDVDIRETWAMSFDRVYDSRFVNEDTRDHFGVGMNMADDNDTSMAFDRVRLRTEMRRARYVGGWVSGRHGVDVRAPTRVAASNPNPSHRACSAA